MREQLLQSPAVISKQSKHSGSLTSSSANTDIQTIMERYGIGEPWTSKQLDQAKIQTNYIVDSILVEGQHAVIAGAPKSMKTSIAIDLAISLGLADRFLATFAVGGKRRVLFLSAESGEGTIQETARRVSESKGVQLSECENVHWGFWVPRARVPDQLTILDSQLEQTQAEVVVIDPLYQCLSGEDMSNLSMNGEQLQTIVRYCTQRNATAVLIDHVKRSSTNANTFRPLELNDVSGAGKAEFFRQWILIGRRERFNPEVPLHRLWLSVGGSAGHCGLFAVNIDERRKQPQQPRQWLLNVEHGSTAIAADKQQRAQRTAEKREAEAAAKLERNVQKIRETFRPGTAPWTKTQIREHARLNNNNVGTAIARLIQNGELVETETKRPTGRYTAYRWTTNRGSSNAEPFARG